MARKKARDISHYVVKKEFSSSLLKVEMVEEVKTNRFDIC